MNHRILYLKSIVKMETEDIDAYRTLSQKEYTECPEEEEIFRKARFLKHFAEKIPVVMDRQELLVGSMRFWRSRVNSRNKGHIVVDYRMILQEGIPGILKKIDRLAAREAASFGEAMEAFSVLIRRYAAAAEQWGMELVAETCRSLNDHAPQTFHQALQLIWFVHLFLHAEGMAAAVSFGRFDVYLYPFYQRDIEEGRLTREQAKELLMCFWLKSCEGDESQNMTLGGNEENELSLLCLEVAADLGVQQPSVSVRIGNATTNAFWEKTIALIKCKIGMPAIFCDNTVIAALKHARVANADAENYAIVGCYEANSDGNTFGTTANAGMFYLHDVLLEFLNRDADYLEFDEFYHGFRKFLREKYNTDILNQFRKNWEYIRDVCVSPFQSACMAGCLETGVPAEWGGCQYTMAGINILGIGTLVDSIYTMQKIVFEEKVCSYREMVRQVKNNFPDRLLAEKCKSLKGKYGTDNPETNQIARELSLLIAELVEQGEIYPGVTPYAGLFVFLNDVYSSQYEATPDGRLRGERVSYGIGASDCCVGKTVTSVLNSAAHIANDHFADGNPLMFRISEKEVEGESGEILLKSLIQGYFEKGGFHLQFNVTDAEILKKAKENPEEYPDLIVRISGYSEYFTRLNETLQTALIERE